MNVTEQISCPSRSELEQLLSDDRTFVDLERHVESCVRCQQVLDELSSSDVMAEWKLLLTQTHCADDDDSLPRTSLKPDATSESPTFPVIPGYSIDSEIGRGGMGVVFRATDLELNRTVAVKMLVAGSLAGPERLARFQTEAETNARLKHPGIVQIYHVGSYQDLPFLVLEYVNGPNLAESMADTPLPPRTAAELVRQLAEAVHHAHGLGIIHRDLKPANVLLETAHKGPDIAARIADFGLARVMESDSRTATGDLLGTPAWMSPEQATGEQIPMPEQIDVYGIGAILYFALTGRAPFSGRNPAQIIHHVKNQVPLSPRRINSAVPVDLEVIALKCLEKDPAHRYPSARSVADDLNRFLQHQPVLARRLTTLDRFRRWCRRHPGQLAMLFVTAFVLAAAVFRLDDIHRQQQQQQYLENIERAQAAWHANDALEAGRLLTDCPEDQRRWEWYLLNSSLHAGSRVIAHMDDAVTGVAASPVGRHYAVATECGDTALIDSLSGNLFWKRQSDSDSRVSVDFSQDGQRLLVWSAESITVVDVETAGTSHVAVSGHVTAAKIVSPSEIVFGTADGTVALVNGDSPRRTFAGNSAAIVATAATAEHVLAVTADNSVLKWRRDAADRPADVITTPDKNATLAVFSQKSDFAAVYSSNIPNDETDVIDLRTGKETQSFFGHQGITRDIAFSPDGEFLATCSDDTIIKCFARRNHTIGTRDRAIRTHQAPVRSIAFCPESRILSGDADGVVCVSELPAPRGLTFASMAHHAFASEHDGTVRSVAVSPTADQFVSGGDDGRALLRDMNTGAVAMEFPQHPDSIRECVFSSSGRQVATACDDGIVRGFDLATGTEVFRLRGHRLNATCLAWSSDETLMASGSGGDVREIVVWNVQNEEIVARFSGHERTIRDIDFSRDGQLLVSAGGPTIRIWNIPRESEVLCVEAHEGRSFSCRFIHDGRLCVSGGNDGAVRIWDTVRGRLIHDVRCTQSGRPFLAVSPDEQRLVIHSIDATRVVDVNSGKVVLRLNQGPVVPTRSVIAKNGTLISWCSDRVIRIWRPEVPADSVQ